MTKALLVLAVAIATIAIGCKPNPENSKGQNLTNWVMEVRFVDNTVDTIVVKSYQQPNLRITTSFGYMDLGDSTSPAACYVKSIRLLESK
jgi:hypothetical protein